MRFVCKVCGNIADDNKPDVCPICKMNNTYIEDENKIDNQEDLQILRKISNDSEFINAMSELKKNNVIEYQMRMSQFKNQVEQQEAMKRKEQLSKLEQTSKIKCPRCGSDVITTGKRGFKLTTGFIGSNKTVNRCGKCGYSWQPKK